MRYSRTVGIFLLLTGGCLLAACSQDSDQADKAKAARTAASPALEMHAPAMKTKPAMGMRGAGMNGAEMEKMPPEGKLPKVAAPLGATQASAAEQVHEVKAAVTRFLPMVLFIEPGDTVHWVNMAGHNTHSLAGMIPPGAEAWESRLGEAYSRRFTVPGAYVYQCVPHASLGMQGIIVVGKAAPANLDSIVKSPLNKGMTARAIRKLKQALDAHSG